MAKKELHIEISPTGEVKVTVKCIAGQTCVEETKFLENALGNTIESREMTSEFYEQGEIDTVTTKTGG